LGKQDPQTTRLRNSPYSQTISFRLAKSGELGSNQLRWARHCHVSFVCDLTADTYCAINSSRAQLSICLMHMDGPIKRSQIPIRPTWFPDSQTHPTLLAALLNDRNWTRRILVDL